ncbi:MAG: acyltransferase family protein [Demequina sp.]|nr:acyltransferase family protein [Demequina sp.]
MARERVTWIDTARGGALTLVVLVHSSLWLHRSGYRTAHWLDQMNLALDAVRMPTLVAISGLFAATIGTWSAREVLRRRVLPLALLYVVWAALGQIIVGPSRQPGTDGWANLLLVVVRPDLRVWYLYALALFILGAWALRAVPSWILIPVALGLNLWTMSRWPAPPMPLDLQNWEYVGEHWAFFVVAQRCAAAYWAFAGRTRPVTALWAGGAFALAAGAALATDTATNPVVLLALCALGTLAVLAISPLVASARSLGFANAIGRNSLGVYVTHLPVLAIFTLATPLFPAGPGARSVVPLALAAVALACSYGITRALDRWAPVPFLRPWWSTAREPQGALAPAQ